MNDDEIIELYFKRDETALKMTELKYRRLFLSIAMNILGDPEESEECVNDALLGVWNSVPPARPNNFKAFVCKVARNCSLKALSRDKAQKRSRDCLVSLDELEETVPDSRITQSDGELAEILNKFLRTLKPDARNVFIRKYWYFDSLKDIMKRYSFSESKVNNLLYHTRNKLREHLKKEGINV